jgi:hypothetical protein
MAEQSREVLPYRGGLSGESSTQEDDTNSTSLNNMFSLLLQEMKSINSGISALQESRQFDVESVDLDEVAPLTDSDEENEPEQRDAELESIDTRVDKLAGQPKTTSDPDILTNIAQEFAIKENTGEVVNDNLVGIVASLVKDRLAEDKLKQKLQK